MAARSATVVFGSYADLEATRDCVQECLGLTLNLHESTYRGGDYLRGVSSLDETVIVQCNAELDEPAEPINRPTIVYVEGTRRGAELRGLLDWSPLEFVREDA